jgi:hypothetical protein
MHKDADMKSHDASAQDKSGAHTTVSADPKFKDHTMHKDTQTNVEHVAGHHKSGAHNDSSADAKPAAHTQA